ncbi:MAG TPA: MXAN_5187 C-terminal domain-containing protein [Geobacteraceae bacterium]|nr:MXAN_5187 C-terminal domain-containing protein [Geobacteraceae bacterium]
MRIPEEIALFEVSLNELIIKYEQYFLGLEKRAPLQLLDEVEKAARKYQGFQIVNTMLKFKYNATIARLNSYKQYWNRITRLIEDGKYSRDRFKMEMHLKKEHNVTEEKEQKKESSTNPEVQRLYHQFIEARKACHLPVKSITPEMVSAAIEKQKPAIISKYHCSKVEFVVVVEKGTPKIKARPKL